MPGLRLTPAIIEAVLNSSDLPDYPENGKIPKPGVVRVTVDSQRYDVPVVVAHTFIAGSGPIGSTFARVLLGQVEKNRPSVVIADIGSQEGAVKGRNLKNSLKYQKDIDAFVHVIQGHLQPISVVPTHPMLSMYGNNPNQERSTNLPASAVTRTVGGMATHWTCCCPEPRFDERKNSPIDARELDILLKDAGKYLSVNDKVFNNSIRHTIVKDTLLAAFKDRNIGNLPLGVKSRDKTRNYLTWTGSDTILGSDAVPPDPKETVVDRMLWMTETRVTYLVKNAASNSVVAAVLRDFNKDDDVLIKARVFIVACGAVSTPQILFRSGIPKVPEALGCYLSEQSVAFCQIVLKRSIINSAKDPRKYPQFVKRIADHKKAHPDDPIPIPFDDLEPQVYIPYNPNSTPDKNFPWHVQIHRDAFSYGDVGPTVDPRIIVDLRFFGKSDIDVKNKVMFTREKTDDQDGWDGGDTDLYGMPQATFHVSRSKDDIERDKRMMEDMKVVAQELGEYLPNAQPQFMPAGLALHITGTTRMTPKDTPANQIEKVSVVDTDSKVHGYNNLWLGGCNVIPDSTSSNPTRTAMAYGIKAANAVHTFLYPTAKLVMRGSNWTVDNTPTRGDLQVTDQVGEGEGPKIPNFGSEHKSGNFRLEVNLDSAKLDLLENDRIVFTGTYTGTFRSLRSLAGEWYQD